MANTLTNLLPDAYAAMDIVSRELVGMIPAVTLDANASRAALNQSVVTFQTPASTASDITAGQEVPDAGDQTIGNTTVQITKSRAVQIRWNGEQSLHINNGGHGTNAILRDQIAQAMRTLVNEVETDLCNLHTTTSRAYGTAGTTPFGTSGDYTDFSYAMKILKDNGAPTTDNQIVLNTTAAANLLGKQASVDNAGDATMQRQGVFYRQTGLEVRESGQIATATAGTGSSATTDNAGYAVGATTITLASAGTGTIVAGDVITFAGDPNKYVVESGDADVSDGGTITLAAPGLREAIPASTTAITVLADSARNMVFNRSAIILAARQPALPEGGDKAVDRTVVTDPRSGLSFEFAMYPGYRRMNYLLGLAWGVKNIKPAHTGLLLG